jgi:D-alanyl-D-alanine carboxypeptidase
MLSIGLGELPEGAGAYTPKTACGMFSATKTLSFLTALSLQEDGTLELDVPLGKFREGLPETWASIPFWRLLNHTSGITTFFDKPELAEWDASRLMTDEDVLGIVREYPLDFPPGPMSRYQQSGYGVLSALLEERTGKRFTDLH